MATSHFAGRGGFPSSTASSTASSSSSIDPNAPFQRLKPICVQLLGHTSGNRISAQQSQPLAFTLKRLKAVLEHLAAQQRSTSQSILTPSLIHYVFFPIAQLLRACPRGAVDLPDQVQQLVFECLTLLASQWWCSWTEAPQGTPAVKAPGQPEWTVWQQLVILSSVTIGGTPGTSEKPSTPLPFSDETKLAALSFLRQLLRPRSEVRLSEASERQQKGKGRQKEWEWDGESELPSLDDLEAEEEAKARSPTDRGEAQPDDGGTSRRQVYPTASHLKFSLTDATAKGALGHALTSCLELACQGDRPLELRTLSLRVAHHIVVTWIAAASTTATTNTLNEAGGLQQGTKSELGDEDAFQIPAFVFVMVDEPSSSSKGSGSLAENSANRLRPLLPGITSSLTRLVSGRLKGPASASARRSTPGELSAIALAMLRDLLLLTLGDAATRAFRDSGRASIGRDQTPGAATAGPAATRRRSLRALEELVLEAEGGAETDPEEALFLGNGDDAMEQAEPPHPNHRNDGPAGASLSTQDEQDPAHKYLLPTLARIQIALRAFSPLASPFSSRSVTSPPTHPSTRRGLVSLALALVLYMGETFAWFDTRLEQGAASFAPGSPERATEVLLSWIVDSAGKDDITAVVAQARQALAVLFADNEPSLPLSVQGAALRSRVLAALSSMTVRTLAELPKVLRAQEDSRVQRLAIRLDTTVAFASGSLSILAEDGPEALTSRLRSPEAVSALSDLLGPAGGIERWGPALVDAVRVSASSATTLHDIGTEWPPRLRLEGLESGSAQSVMNMLRSFGRACAIVATLHGKTVAKNSSTGHKIKAGMDPFHVVLYFVRQGGLYRTCRVQTADGELETLRSHSLTALMIASEMLRGVADELDDKKLAVAAGDAGRRLRKVAHKLGKQVFEMVLELWEADWEEAVETALVHKSGGSAKQRSVAIDDASRHLMARAEEGEDGGLVEKVKGFSVDVGDMERPERFGPALDLAFVGPATIGGSGSSSSVARRAFAAGNAISALTRAESSLNLSNAFLLSLVASSSMLLGTSFRPLLFKAIYPLTSGLASSNRVLRSTAESALREVAYASAYASVQSCVLDHADYLLGAACQRLVSGLDEELRAQFSIPTLRLKGGAEAQAGLRIEKGAVIPLLSAQKAPFVLVEMIRMLGSQVVPLVEDAVDEIMDALDRFHAYQEVCTGLLGVLDGVLEVMASEEAQLKLEKRGGDETKPKDALAEFAAWYRRHTGAAADAVPEDEAAPIVEEDAAKEEGPTTTEPTRTQQVVQQIMQKAVPFLSHPSPMLRASVLALLQHGAAVLGSQGREVELLSVVHAAWPFIMSRLGRAVTSTSPNDARHHRILDLDPNHKREARWDEAEKQLTEVEPVVWIEAVKLVEVLAAQVPEFLGKKVEQDAWPRFDMLLHLLAHRFGPVSQSSGSARLTANTETAIDGEAQAQGVRPLILPSSTNVPARIVLSVLSTLTIATAYMASRMSEQTVWSITTHPHILSTLDRRQPQAVREAATRLYSQLAKRNWEATRLALASAFDNALRGDDDGVGRAMLRFLRQQHIHPLPEMIQSILDD
ncbi:hypothetical protein ACQY0O_005901 [Thecaphora frezii]